MQSGKSASSVGDAATSAVVTGIVAIIAACGLFSVIFYVLGV
jgi:phospholipid/cholesterol/gamma-HCH transport system permease protein